MTATATEQAGRGLRHWLSPDRLIVYPLLIIVGYLLLPPLGILIYGAFTDTPPAVTPNFTFETVFRAYGQATVYPALFNSLIYAAATSTLVLIVGGFLAWVVVRTESAVRHMTDFFVLAPILMPAVLLVSGWILLMSPRSGFFNLIAMQYFGASAPIFDIYSFSGMVWVGMLQELPLAFLWLWPAFRSMNPELEEAGLISGAGMLTVMRDITLPILRPTLLAAWIIFFIYSLGSLSVPLLLGLPAGIFLYSTEIYLATRRVPTDLNLAAAYILLFLFVAMVGLHAYRRATRDASRFVTITGKAYRPRLIRLGIWQPVTTALAIVILLLVAGLPLFILVWNAFMPYIQPPSLAALERATTANFSAALNYGPATRAVTNSVILGIGAGIVTTIIGGLVAWASLRMKGHRRSLAALDYMCMAPIAIPGMIIGVGMLWLYLVLPVPIYGTRWILLLAYILNHLPFAVRITQSGLSQLHKELEEAADVSGASRMRTIWSIVLPLLAPSIIASFVYVTLRSFREYTASIFLTAPGTEVFAVLVLDMWDGGNPTILAAYVTMVIGLVAVLLVAIYWITRRLGMRI
jgi:iron(III) transport system permease protein